MYKRQHEIRTPLSLIRLPLEKLQEIEHEGKEAKYLSVIDKNVNYLLGITNQLLDFQKMENGALQLNLVSCDIKEIVNDVYSQFTTGELTIYLSLIHILIRKHFRK